MNSLAPLTAILQDALIGCTEKCVTIDVENYDDRDRLVNLLIDVQSSGETVPLHVRSPRVLVASLVEMCGDPVMLDDEENFENVVEDLRTAYRAETGRRTRVKVLDADAGSIKFSRDDDFCAWITPLLQKQGHVNYGEGNRRFRPKKKEKK